MSEQLSAEHALVQPFVELVGSHAERAQLWCIQQSRQLQTPYEEVEFTVVDEGGYVTDPDSPNVEEFRLKIFARMTADEKESYGPQAPIVAFWNVDEGFGLLDGCDKVETLTGLSPGEKESRPGVINALMEEIRQLKEDQTLVPAYQRRFLF